MDEIKFVIALTLLLFGPFVRSDDEALLACVKLMKPVYSEEMCCESLKSIDNFDEQIKECNTKSSAEELVCADFECFLNKQGLLEGGMINNERAKTFLDGIAKDYPKEKNVIERVKEECLDRQYEEYPPDDDCTALKFYVCVYTNVLVECESWKDTEVCKEASDLANKCKEAK